MAESAVEHVDHHPAVEPVGDPPAAHGASALLAIVAAVSLVICVASFAIRQAGVGVDAASIALLAAGAALAWQAMDGRRARQMHRERQGDIQPGAVR